MNAFGPIQVVPPGLLGFLQLKSFGQNPYMIGDTYAPVVEMRDWLLQARSQEYTVIGVSPALTTGTGNALFTANPPALQTPPTEWWYVWHYTIIPNTLAAGDTLQFLAPIMSRPIAGTPQTHVLNDGQFTQIAGAGATGAVTAQGFWVPPQSNLGMRYSLVAAVSLTFSAYLRYTPLPA